MREEVKNLLDLRIRMLYEHHIVSVFPVQPLTVLRMIPNCRCMSYRRLAEVSGRNLTEIVRACGSGDGSTTYDPILNRYLVVINYDGRSRARVRWTAAHELGHILAGHFLELGTDAVRVSDLPCMEDEADYFAASFLAPIAAIRRIGAKSAADVRDWFDISQAAAEYRWAEFLRSHKDGCLEDYFSWARARSVLKTGKRMSGTVQNIVPDDEELRLL